MGKNIQDGDYITKNGSLTTEAIENFMLFVPFSIFLLWAFHKELLGTADILKAKK